MINYNPYGVKIQKKSVKGVSHSSYILDSQSYWRRYIE